MKKCKLGEIADFKTGPFGTQFKASEYTSSGYPVINVKNIGIGNIIDNDIDFISEETRARLSEHIIHEGDIVFARKGSVVKASDTVLGIVIGGLKGLVSAFIFGAAAILLSYASPAMTAYTAGSYICLAVKAVMGI